MKTIYISIDVESDGPCPGLYSMIELGAVAITSDHQKSWPCFSANFRPISKKFIPEALAVSGYSREETEDFPYAAEGVETFHLWLEGLKSCTGASRLTMISDNPAFDWQFVNYYFARGDYTNPLGWSARRIGDIYAGQQNDLLKNWKHLRKTKHTHKAIDDAMGNAEAFVEITKNMVK